MEIVLSAPQPLFASALRAEASGLADVSVYEGSILDLACDAIISPANSFGFMDGGIDQTYTAHFGEEVQTRVRENILYQHQGELLVGAATIVPTGNPHIPHLIAAPTMRVPMWLGEETVNPYLATRAVMLLVREGRFTSGPHIGEPVKDHVKRLALPGMGTGVGGVPFAISARQMVRAIAQFRDGPYRLPTSWAEASEDHIRLYSEKVVPLQRS